MALKKTVIFENGTVAEYHRLDMMRIQNLPGENVRVVVNVQSFVSGDFRKNSLEHAIHQDVHAFTLPKTDIETKSSLTAAYDQLKTLDAYKDAEDV